MIGAIASTSSSLSRVSAGDAPNKSKEAALQQQIDAKSAQQARITCSETAAKIGKDIAALRTRLATLQAGDKNVTSTTMTTISQASATRQAEFDGEQDTRTFIWA